MEFFLDLGFGVFNCISVFSIVIRLLSISNSTEKTWWLTRGRERVMLGWTLSQVQCWRLLLLIIFLDNIFLVQSFRIKPSKVIIRWSWALLVSKFLSRIIRELIKLIWGLLLLLVRIALTLLWNWAPRFISLSIIKQLMHKFLPVIYAHSWIIWKVLMTFWVPLIRVSYITIAHHRVMSMTIQLLAHHTVSQVHLNLAIIVIFMVFLYTWFVSCL